MLLAFITLIATVAVPIAIAAWPASNDDSELKRVDVRVVEDATVEVIATDTDDDMRNAPAQLGTGIDLLLRNSGETVAVVSSIRLTIVEARELTACRAFGDELDISHSYTVTLPRQVEPETTIEGALSQQVDADNADRFVVTVGIARKPEDPPASILYRLRGTLTYNSDRSVDLGEFVIASEFPDSRYYFSETRDEECESSNHEILKSMTSPETDTIVSTELTNLLSSSESTTPPASAATSTTEFSGRTTVDASQACGTITSASGEAVIVMVENGNTSCVDALDLVSTYFHDPPETPQGSSGSVRIGTWLCSSSSAAAAAQSGVAGSCDNETSGDRIQMLLP